jgi:hypothetical protein
MQGSQAGRQGYISSRNLDYIPVICCTFNVLANGSSEGEQHRIFAYLDSWQCRTSVTNGTGLAMMPECL